MPSQDVLEQEMMWMKEHLSQLGSPVVLCHNDLLCKNIIHNLKEGGFWNMYTMTTWNQTDCIYLYRVNVCISVC